MRLSSYGIRLSETGLFNVILPRSIQKSLIIPDRSSKRLPWNYVVSVALSSQSPAYLPPEEEKCEPLYMAFHFISNRVSTESRAQQQEDFWPVSPQALSVPDPSLGIQMCDQTRLLYDRWRSMLRCSCLHGRNFTYSKRQQDQ